MTEEKTIWWNDENSSVMLIDQTLLPTEYKVIEITEVSRLADAIRRLEVRGAPALGVAGAFGVALSATRCVSDVEFDETIASDAALLKSTRPTAVNLAWGVDKVLRSMENLPPEMARIMALFAAKNIAENDTKACMFLGHNGDRKS
ncbi:MAG: S-methyl-5-thioribose-1-phosphate isomerase, partial [Methanocorpusculum sp.]|nr:S-methyl-5-thioribose-1-phosphate isomerase [Methanocorpusculum sp.]